MPTLPAEPEAERLPDLAPWLQEKLRLNGYSLTETALRLDIPEIQLRASFTSNRFSVFELPGLINLTGCEEFYGEGGLEKLQESYSFKFLKRRAGILAAHHDWPAAQRQVGLRQAIERIEQPVIDKNWKERKLREPVVDALESLFSAMGENDVYCHLSLSTLAAEFCMSRITRRMIGEGVKRGATYIYAYPAHDLSDNEAFRPAFDDRARIVEAVVNDMKRTFIEIRKMDEERVNAQILLLPVSARILTPGVEYLLYQPYLPKERTFDTPRAMMVVPLAGKGHEGNRVLLPLSLPMAGMLLGVLSDAMAASGLPQREPSPWLCSPQSPRRTPAVVRGLSHPPP